MSIKRRPFSDDGNNCYNNRDVSEGNNDVVSRTKRIRLDQDVQIYDTFAPTTMHAHSNIPNPMNDVTVFGNYLSSPHGHTGDNDANYFHMNQSADVNENAMNNGDDDVSMAQSPIAPRDKSFSSISPVSPSIYAGQRNTSSPIPISPARPGTMSLLQALHKGPSVPKSGDSQDHQWEALPKRADTRGRNSNKMRSETFESMNGDGMVVEMSMSQESSQGSHKSSMEHAHAHLEGTGPPYYQLAYCDRGNFPNGSLQQQVVQQPQPQPHFEDINRLQMRSMSIGTDDGDW